MCVTLPSGKTLFLELVLGPYLGDNEEVNKVACILRGRCRFCESQLQPTYRGTQVQKRDYNQPVHDKKATGIDPIDNRLQNFQFFDLAQNLPPDILHLLPLGVVRLTFEDAIFPLITRFHSHVNDALFTLSQKVPGMSELIAYFMIRN